MRRHSTITHPSVDAKSQLHRLGARAKKGLGQHFLSDRNVLDKIISAAELASSDTVIEVGPGLGILTEELLKKAGQVIAIEVDSKLASSLEKKLYKSPQLTVLNADILQPRYCAISSRHRLSPASWWSWCRKRWDRA